MIRSLFAFCIFVFALVLAPSARAAFTPPPNTAHVTDTAGKLTEPERIAIDRKLEDFRLRTSVEIAVFIPATLDGEDIETVAFATFRAWKLGAKGKDNGALLVIAPVERKARIQTGKGAEGDLPDLKANDIIRQTIRPRLTPGSENYRAAVDDATSAMMKALDTGATGGATTKHKSGSVGEILLGFMIVFGIPLIFIILIIRAFVRSAFTSNGGSANRGWASGGTWSNDSSWSSGGGGGGDWGGGGGGGGDSGFSGGGGDTGGGGSSDSF